MTTVAQVKRVMRPLFERNADLALVGRLVVITPVRHLVRGVFFDRGSDPVVFQPTWFVNFLFKPGAGVIDTWGERLFKSGRPVDYTKPAFIRARVRKIAEQMALPVRERRYPKSWGLWVAYDPATAIQMCKVIERQALPMLRSLQSIDDFVGFTSDQARFPWTYLGSNYFNEPYVQAAQGDFAAALATCTKLAAQEPTRPRIKEMLRLLAGGDRRGLAGLLHGWEADSVKRLKLEGYWELTPFPIEL
jgi:hypothetical protein